MTGLRARFACSCCICSSGIISRRGAAGRGRCQFANTDDAAQRQLRKNPGLKIQLDEALDAAYEDARLEAASETGLPLSVFPATRPFDYAEIMERPIVWPGDEA